MKSIIIAIAVIISAIILITGYNETNGGYASNAGCEAYLYISNNSLFEVTLTIDGIGTGNLLVGKNKTYTVDLLNDTPKKIKVKVEWLDPDYIEPKSYYILTKGKLECGQSDSMYIAHTK